MPNEPSWTNQSLEALWTVDFIVNGQTLPNVGVGIVVIDNGRVLGGDSAYTYVGKLTVVNGEIAARIHVRKYLDIPGISSVTGLDDYFLDLKGKPSSDVVLLIGTLEGKPGMQMHVKMTRRAALD